MHLKITKCTLDIKIDAPKKELCDHTEILYVINIFQPND